MRKKVKELIPQQEGEESFTPQAEGNLYYDTSKTYIGLHGDTERTFVIGLRLGEQIPLHFQWFLKTEKLGEKTTVQFSPGDVYVMSFKAVGTDWKKRLIPTLRHAAGDTRLIKKL
jgi:alkylated DNA repair dioxygenase AlkB